MREKPANPKLSQLRQKEYDLRLDVDRLRRAVYGQAYPAALADQLAALYAPAAAYQLSAEWMFTIADPSFAARLSANALDRKTGPKKFVSRLARISASVWASSSGLVTEMPALLTKTVTSPACSAAAAIDDGSVTSSAIGTIRSSFHSRGVRAVA